MSDNDGLSNRCFLARKRRHCHESSRKGQSEGPHKRLVISSVIPPQARRVLRQAHGLAKGVLIMLTPGCISSLEFVCG